MQFRTEITLPAATRQISYADRMLLIGSCFSENIGNWLENHYLDVLVNPFGILYNPASIARCIRLLLSEKRYNESDIFPLHGLYHSFDHHSRFSCADSKEMLSQLNRKRSEATDILHQTDVLLITFGTAWVYSLAKTGEIVGNCHKLPEKTFTRRQLSIAEIIDEWDGLITELVSNNPNLRIIFTVSPIRHIKDTLHGNQLSKATLLLAIEELCTRFPQAEYFAAYEMLIDDLRDYRFYASDMLHPSDTAVAYIREKFSNQYFSQATQKLFAECEKLRKALEHKPSDPQSESYKRFLTQNIQKIEQLIDKNPFFTLRKPLIQFQERLK